MTSCVDWNSVAADWDRHRHFVEHMKVELTAALVSGLALDAGDRVLELGAGTGELAAILAGRVAPNGTVLASDAAPAMVALLKGRLDGLPGVEIAEIDAVDIPVPTASVAAVAWRMGLMLLPEPELAVREIARVLQPGGRAAIAVWADAQHNPWLTTLGMAAMMHGVVRGGPPVGPGTPFSLADPDALATLFDAAGFTDVTVTSIGGTARYADVDAFLATAEALAPPLAAALGAASDSERAAVRSTADQGLARFRTPEGLRLPCRSLLLTARRNY